MGQTKSHQFNVYLDDELAKQMRKAARQYGGNSSAFLRSLVEREFASRADRLSSERRMIEYLVGGVNKFLDHVDPTYVKQVAKVHSDRMAQGKSYAD